MDFDIAIKTCFKHYIDFRGRARRSEYWYFSLLYACILIALICTEFEGKGMGLSEDIEITRDLVTTVLVIVLLVFSPPAIAVSARRLHDLGFSGWLVVPLVVLSLIPYLDILVLIGQAVWFAQKGTTGTNRFGPDPITIIG